MKVLVCGGRFFDNSSYLRTILQDLHEGRKGPVSVVIEGGALGADRLASEWAEDFGIPVMRFPAPWRVAGKSAGPWRNGMMLEHGKPDLVIAFPGGRGTDNMITQAERAGVEVYRTFARADVS